MGICTAIRSQAELHGAISMRVPASMQYKMKRTRTHDAVRMSGDSNPLSDQPPPLPEPLDDRLDEDLDDPLEDPFPPPPDRTDEEPFAEPEETLPRETPPAPRGPAAPPTLVGPLGACLDTPGRP